MSKNYNVFLEVLKDIFYIWSIIYMIYEAYNKMMILLKEMIKIWVETLKILMN